MSRPAASPWVAKLGYLTLWLLFLLVPIAFSRTANESFRLPKLLLSDALALASLLLLALRLRAVDRIDWKAFCRQPAVLAVVPIVAVATLGLVTSEHFQHVREALLSLWIGAGCLVGWSLALSADEHRKLLRGMIVPATVLAVLAIAQFHGWYTPFEFERNVGERIGLTSFAGGAFDLAAYLVLPCLFVQSALRSATSTRRRWALATAALVCGYALAATQTLTALLALVAGSLVLWLGWLPRRRFFAGAAVIALAAVGLSLGFAPLRQRLDSKIDSLIEGDVNGLLTGRLDGWRAAVWMLRQEPWTGVGHGAYRAEFGTAKDALWHQGVKFYPSQHRVYFTNAHSDVLEALAEWGMPAAVVLLWASLILLRSLRRLSKDDDRSYDRTMSAGLWVLAILALTNFPFRVALVAFPAVLFISWIFAAQREASPPEPLKQAYGPSGRVLAWILCPLLAALLVAEIRHAGRLWQASRVVAVVKSVTVAASEQGRLSQQLLLHNLDLLQATEPLSPVEVALPIARGGQYLLLERPQAAIRAYRQALEIEPRGEIYAHLGRAYLQLGDPVAAEGAFRTAMILDHTQRKRVRGFVTQGRGPRRSGRRDSAESATANSE